MIIEQLTRKVKEVSSQTEYWFVRTDYGEHFETYCENGFIAIGWNNITLEELGDPKSDEKIRKKLIKSENFDDSKKSTKRKLSSIINKLHSFINLKMGDVVIIPSRNSSRFAFGIIESSQVYIDIGKSFDCEYYKRKKIKWVAIRNTSRLDPNFYKMRFTQHTISNINDYSIYIDNIVSPLYRKNNNTHFVIDINTVHDINVRSLITLIDGIQALTSSINSKFDLNEEIDKNSIRLQLQSPGQIEFKLMGGKSLVLLVAVLSLTYCDNPNSEINSSELNEFIQLEQDTIDKITSSLQELEADKERINNFK